MPEKMCFFLQAEKLKSLKTEKMKSLKNILISFFFFFFSLISCQNNLRILLIGDSIDRFIINDYCLSLKGHLCPSIYQNAFKWFPSNCKVNINYSNYSNNHFNHSNHSNSIILYDLFKFSSRVSSWSVTICNLHHENITLGFLFNMQGVSPNSPWFNKKKSYFGVETYNETKNNTVKDVFNHFQLPAIEKIEYVMGGSPHAISLSSYLWDLYRLTEYNNYYPLCTTPNHSLDFINSSLISTPILSKSDLSSFRSNWIQSWYHNVTEFINYISYEVFPTVEWIGWRLLHNITRGFNHTILDCILQEEKDDIIWKMNSLIQSSYSNILLKSSYHSNFNQIKKKLHLLPWLAENPYVNRKMNESHQNLQNNDPYMRDNLHPNSTPNIQYFTRVIQKIKRDLKWRT